MTRAQAMLLLAAGLCAVVFMAAPADNESCINPNQGTINIVNTSDYVVSLTFSGPAKYQTVVAAAYYHSFLAKAGNYSWVGYFVNSQRNPQTGACVVVKDRTVTITIK